MFTKDWFYRGKKGVCLLQNRMLFYRLQRFHRQRSPKIASFHSDMVSSWQKNRIPDEGKEWVHQWRSLSNEVSPSESGDTPLLNTTPQVHSQASDLRLGSWAQAFWSAPSSNLFLYFCFICGVARTPNSFINSFIPQWPVNPHQVLGLPQWIRQIKSPTSGSLFFIYFN